MLSQRKIKKIIKENSAVFKALEDFEKIGRVITKTRMNFTIDRELAKKFRKYCKENGGNMSKQIEGYIKNKIKTMGKSINCKSYLGD